MIIPDAKVQKRFRLLYAFTMFLMTHYLKIYEQPVTPLLFYVHKLETS